MGNYNMWRLQGLTVNKGVYQQERRYPYFDVAEGFAWSYEPESYAGGSLCY